MRITGLLLCGWLLTAACGHAAIDPSLLKPLASEDSDTKIAAIVALAQAAPEAALPVLKALADNALAVAGERLVIVDGERVLDAASQAEITAGAGGERDDRHQQPRPPRTVGSARRAAPLFERARGALASRPGGDAER
jgi:hypothetical protein